MDNATIYFTKSTNRELYKYRNILEYHDGSYVLTNPISEHNIIEMRNNMDDNDAIEFDKFLEKNWGIKMKRFDEQDDITENIAQEKAEKKTIKKGRKAKAEK